MGIISKVVSQFTNFGHSRGNLDNAKALEQAQSLLFRYSEHFKRHGFTEIPNDARHQVLEHLREWLSANIAKIGWTASDDERFYNVRGNLSEVSQLVYVLERLVSEGNVGGHEFAWLKDGVDELLRAANREKVSITTKAIKLELDDDFSSGGSANKPGSVQLDDPPRGKSSY